MKRVGCFPCIMSRKDELRRIAKLCPEVFDKIRAAEQDTGLLHRNGYSSFFSPNMVPPPQRSKEITTKTGRVMKICTVDDVIRWSTTARGGNQQAMHFDDVVNYEKLPMGETSRSCPSSLGMCE